MSWKEIVFDAALGYAWILVTACVVGLTLLVFKPDAESAMWIFRILVVVFIGWVFVAVLLAEKLRSELRFVEESIAAGTKGLQALRSSESTLARQFVVTQGQRTDLAPLAFVLSVDRALDELKAPWRVGLEQIPALFTALGILFTFYGLVEGLHGFDLAQNSDGVMRDLGGLLDGVGVAFESSLWGIFLSVASLLVTRQTLARIASRTDSIRSMAESRSDRDGVSPTRLLTLMRGELSAIRKSNDDQSSKLGTLATDLANAISNTLAEPLENLNSGFNRMADAQASQQADALHSVMNQFQVEFSNTLGTRFDQLNESLEKTLDWHQQTQSMLEQTLAQLNNNSVLMSGNLAREEELIKLRASNEEARKQQLEEMMERMASLQSYVYSLVHSFDSSARAWEQQTESTEAMARVSQNLLDRIDGNISTGYERIELLVRQMTQSIDLSEQRYKELVEQIRHELDTNLRATFKLFDSETAGVVDHFSGTLMQISSTMEDLNGLLNRTQSQIQGADV